MRHLLDSDPETVSAWLAERGQPAYRAGQIRQWVFRRNADFDRMSDLPGSLREEMAREFAVFSTRIVAHWQAEDKSEKLLLELADGERIECVLLRDGQRRTACVSSQVGCGMGCVFCASGLDGLARNLTGGEIVEQMLRLAQLLPADQRLSHVVVMGIGEPLANLPAVLSALGEASRRDGLAISPRRITISTVGLPAAMHRLADAGRGYNLAVSLHAADDELRRRLVLAAEKVTLAQILAAADEYFDASGRRLTFEYVLLSGINDSAGHAERLARLLSGRAAMLNVIACNPVAGLPYRPPSPAVSREFVDLLKRHRVNVQLRRRKGSRIEAACGQLRRLARGTTETVIPA